MNRLDTELRRLFLPAGAAPAASADPTDLEGTDGRTKVLVLELARPADWSQLSRVWKGVQADLEMPAPAIAVDGKGAYQLWFSLAEPIPTPEAATFLEALRARYLADLAPGRTRVQPSPHAAGSARVPHAGALPPAQVAPEQWSAFVTPDLAPLFSAEPWLDHPPGIDAQADLLSRLVSTPVQIFIRASARLQQVEAAPPKAEVLPQRTSTAAAGDELDPRSFLLQVMRDPSVDLRLRIEAAKALLP
jgi:hypothetical protein